MEVNFEEGTSTVKTCGFHKFNLFPRKLDLAKDVI